MVSTSMQHTIPPIPPAELGCSPSIITANQGKSSFVRHACGPFKEGSSREDAHKEDMSHMPSRSTHDTNDFHTGDPCHYRPHCASPPLQQMTPPASICCSPIFH